MTDTLSLSYCVILYMSSSSLGLSFFEYGMKEMVTERLLESFLILRFWIPIQGLVVRGESVPEGKPSTEV